MVPRLFSWFLEQTGLAAFVNQAQPNGGFSHASIESLKYTLKKTWAKIPQETLRKAAEEFCSKQERVLMPEADILNDILHN